MKSQISLLKSKIYPNSSNEGGSSSLSSGKHQSSISSSVLNEEGDMDGIGLEDGHDDDGGLLGLMMGGGDDEEEDLRDYHLQILRQHIIESFTDFSLNQQV